MIYAKANSTKGVRGVKTSVPKQVAKSERAGRPSRSNLPRSALSSTLDTDEFFIFTRQLPIIMTFNQTC
jgi:hypothetical protein